VFFGIVTWWNWGITGMTEDNHTWEVIWILGALALTGGAMFPQFWKPVWIGFLATVVLCFSIITWGQTQIYHGEKTLWTATLEKNPFSWQAQNHLGAALYMEGNWQAAGPHFLRATQLKPENPESHNNLGLYYSRLGRLDDAVAQYEIAVRIKDDTAMRTNLGNAYEQLGQYDEKTGQHDKAVEEYQKAIATYLQALSISPGNASAHCNMGYALMQLGRVDEAIPEFMRTIELDSTMSEGRGDLLQALRSKGIDPSAPDVSGTFNFDLRKALDLLRSGPLPGPAPGQ
jgi:Flp pilus assembly protein TadD